MLNPLKFHSQVKTNSAHADLTLTRPMLAPLEIDGVRLAQNPSEQTLKLLADMFESAAEHYNCYTPGRCMGGVIKGKPVFLDPFNISKLINVFTEHNVELATTPPNVSINEVLNSFGDSFGYGVAIPHDQVNSDTAEMARQCGLWVWVIKPEFIDWDQRVTVTVTDYLGFPNSVRPSEVNKDHLPKQGMVLVGAPLKPAAAQIAQKLVDLGFPEKRIEYLCNQWGEQLWDRPVLKPAALAQPKHVVIDSIRLANYSKLEMAFNKAIAECNGKPESLSLKHATDIQSIFDNSDIEEMVITVTNNSKAFRKILELIFRGKFQKTEQGWVLTNPNRVKVTLK